MIVTSNNSYSEWGEIFGEQVIATALVARLLNHTTTINIKGESYRLKAKRRAGLINDRSEAAPTNPPHHADCGGKGPT